MADAKKFLLSALTSWPQTRQHLVGMPVPDVRGADAVRTAILLADVAAAIFLDRLTDGLVGLLACVMRCEKE